MAEISHTELAQSFLHTVFFFTELDHIELDILPCVNFGQPREAAMLRYEFMPSYEYFLPMALVINLFSKEIQLTFEQHGFEVHGPLTCRFLTGQCCECIFFSL